jgi:hypothetical protein
MGTVRLGMPIPIIITAPNYAFGQTLKKSAPTGINVAVGYQSAYSPNANVPAVAIVGFSTVRPCDVAREGFVRWLLDETTKDERYTVSYDGVRIEKEASAFGRIFDDLEEHKNDKPNPEDEA